MDSKRKKSPDLAVLNNVIDGDGVGEIGCGPLCKVNYLSQRGKKIQLARILSFVFIPLAGVWGFTIFSLYDTIQTKNDIETAKFSMGIIIRMGRLIHKLQKERDMTILYIGQLGPGTKTFLLRNYEETDDAFTKMAVWPQEFAYSPLPQYRTKDRLINYISQHRKYLEPDNTDTVQEIKFYTDIANQFMSWMIENIRDAGFGAFWKSLVAYQKLTRCSLDTGTERAYGVMFYTRGDFFNWDDLEQYNKRVHSFKIHYQSAVSYSPLVDPLLDNEAGEINATFAINRFRLEIRNAELNTVRSYKSFEKAEWLFDNITIRIDTLFALQERIAQKILNMLDDSISDIGLQIAVYAILVCLAVGICPIIIFYSDFLTSSIARYSKILLEKSSELDEEKSKSNTILYQMIPKAIAERLKESSNVDSEFFRSVTLMFSSIVDFTKLSVKYSPIELVDMLNYLHTYFDGKIENYDVYKVETINDTYLLASGLPVPNGERHVSEIAYFAVDVAKMIHSIGYSRPMHGEQLQILIGISTGPVSAGVIGRAMLRYCVFGDTVNIASRMMSCGARKYECTANKIHISESSYKKLRKTGKFTMQSRGVIDVKGKGQMNTFWLLDSYNDERAIDNRTLPGQCEGVREKALLGPGLGSLEEEKSETQYEPQTSESKPMPTRRMSYSTMHIAQSNL